MRRSSPPGRLIDKYRGSGALYENCAWHNKSWSKRGFIQEYAWPGHSAESGQSTLVVVLQTFGLEPTPIAQGPQAPRYVQSVHFDRGGFYYPRPMAFSISIEAPEHV